MNLSGKLRQLIAGMGSKAGGRTAAGTSSFLTVCRLHRFSLLLLLLLLL